ncbi:MAG: YbhB/YbcL family Raf kinase inhibitor-like protein [Thermoguttaceae bacterium]
MSNNNTGVDNVQTNTNGSNENGANENEPEFILTSKVFKDGEQIPREYTSEGLDFSPPLEWSGLPTGTKELALTCEDFDASSSAPWVHWVIYKIPPTLSELPEKLPQDLELGPPISAVQGKNSWTTGRTIGYRGPDPPAGFGPHRYTFTLYALESKLELEPGAEKNDLLEAIHGKTIGTAQITGTYERQ